MPPQSALAPLDGIRLVELAGLAPGAFHLIFNQISIIIPSLIPKLLFSRSLRLTYPRRLWGLSPPYR